MARNIMELHTISESYEKIKEKNIAFLFEEDEMEKKLASMDQSLHEGFFASLNYIAFFSSWVFNINKLVTKHKNMFKVKKETNISELLYNDSITEKVLAATNKKNITVGSYETSTYNTHCNDEEGGIKIRYPKKFEQMFTEDEIVALCLQVYYLQFKYGMSLAKDIINVSANLVFRMLLSESLRIFTSKHGDFGLTFILTAILNKLSGTFLNPSLEKSIKNPSAMKTYSLAIEKADKAVFTAGYGIQLKTALNKLNLEMNGRLKSVIASSKAFEEDDIKKAFENASNQLGLSNGTFSDRLNILTKISEKKKSLLDFFKKDTPEISNNPENPTTLDGEMNKDGIYDAVKKLKLAIAR